MNIKSWSTTEQVNKFVQEHHQPNLIIKPSRDGSLSNYVVLFVYWYITLLDLVSGKCASFVWWLVRITDWLTMRMNLFVSWVHALFNNFNSFLLCAIINSDYIDICITFVFSSVWETHAHGYSFINVFVVKQEKPIMTDVICHVNIYSIHDWQ